MKQLLTIVNKCSLQISINDPHDEHGMVERAKLFSVDFESLILGNKYVTWICMKVCVIWWENRLTEKFIKKKSKLTWMWNLSIITPLPINTNSFFSYGSIACVLNHI